MLMIDCEKVQSIIWTESLQHATNLPPDYQYTTNDKLAFYVPFNIIS